LDSRADATVSEEEEEQQEEEEEEEEQEGDMCSRSRSSALPYVGLPIDTDAHEEYAHQEHEQVFMSGGSRVCLTYAGVC
jgi:hypothetical protein